MVQLKAGMLRRAVFISVGLLAASIGAFGERRLISLGDRRLSIDCDGEVGSATVVLIAGGLAPAKVWAKVQGVVGKFRRVCSYDFAGLGESDKAASKMQSADEVVTDLHALLEGSAEKGPFILVGHSAGGIYARGIVTKYPRQVIGLVFVDSAHEEQALRFHELDPNWQAQDKESAQWGLFVGPGKRLKWRTELPLIVIGHGRPIQGRTKVSEATAVGRERIWRELWIARTFSNPIPFPAGSEPARKTRRTRNCW